MAILKTGSILVESLLGIAITALALVGLTQLAIRSLSNAGTTQASTEVKLLADEMMDWIKEYKKRTVWTSMPGSNIWCPNFDPEYDAGFGTATTQDVWCPAGEYERVVWIINNTSNIEARVIVRKAGTTAYLYTLTTVFYSY